MKQLIIIVAILMMQWQGVQGQILKVEDKISLEPIQGASISSKNPSLQLQTNAKGEADISSFKDADTITIEVFGYKPLFTYYRTLESQGFKLLLSPETIEIEEVVISASKFEEKKEDIPQQITVVTQKEMAFANQPTTAEVLQNTGEVLVQKSQLGGGSPIIRGFEANKVLMVVDGIRLNNAIYRGGHLQNVLSLDNNVLDRIEIVFGPGSTVYGSDALGGVMHFITKKPLTSGQDGKIFATGSSFLRQASASNEKTGHVDFNIGFKKLAFLTSFTYSDFGDLRQGRDRSSSYPDFGKRYYSISRHNNADVIVDNPNPNIQISSGYKQWDFLQKVLFEQSDKISHTLNFQYSSTSNVPRYDRLAEMNGVNPKYAEWYYGPQLRELLSYTLNLKTKTLLFDDARIIAGYQHIKESRHDRRYNNTGRNNRNEKVDVLTFNADFEKQLKKNEIRYGLEGTHNKVNSSAYKENINTGVITPLDTRYPGGGSVMSTLAAYATHSIELSPKFIISDGLRLSYVHLNSQFSDTSFFPFPFKEITQNNTALSGNLGLVYLPGKDWRFSILGSTGFRAPNVDDLTKVFESVPGNVIVPNPTLKPEHTYNGEISASKLFYKKVRLSATGFYTIYDNAISISTSTFNGADSIMYNGALSRVQTSKNVAEAYITGFSGQLYIDITKYLSFTSNVTYTYGRIKTDTVDYPLDHIPPLFGRSSFNVKVKKFRGEFFALYNGWKRLKDYNKVGEDNLAQATVNGMPSWCTFNIRGAYHINENLELQASLENIFDVNYRVFASGISAPGRNLILTVRGRF